MRFDRAELNDFMEGFLAERMDAFHIPGLTFALVHDRDTLLANGWGLADREEGRAVTPTETVFRAGSVSKLITATAVMQLHERGLLDLEEDVNHYLRSFQVRNPYPEPVTAAQLLTHSSGLGDTLLGQHIRSVRELEPLGRYLTRRLGSVHRTPGRFFRYSDHGASLAGHLVEAISGVPFDVYTEERVFEPLGMDLSSFRQPLPEAWMADLAVGYRFNKGRYVPYPLDFVFTTPACGLFTTAADMARFMIAHLGGGAIGDARILEEATIAEMHQRHFAHHAHLRGRTYGFSEWLENGQRALFHDGSMPGFNSRLLLLPDHGVGFFVSWNSNDMRLKHEFTTQFLDHFFPEEDRAPAQVPIAPRSSPGRFAGSYRDTLYSGRTLEKVVALDEQIRIREGTENTLELGTNRFAEVEPRFFQNLEGEGSYAFKEDDAGRVTHLFIGTGAFERLPWWGTRHVTLGLFALASLIFAWNLLALLLDLVKWLTMGVPAPLLPLSAVVGGLLLGFLLGFGRILPRVDVWEFAYGIPLKIRVLLSLPMVAVSLIAILLVLGIAAWGIETWTVLGRVHYVLVTATALALIPLLHWWNLLGFRSRI